MDPFYLFMQTNKYLVCVGASECGLSTEQTIQLLNKTLSLYKYGQICPGIRCVGIIMASSISFTLLIILLTVTSCCFISDCPGRGKKRMLYSFRPGIAGQVLTETQEVGAVEDQHLLDVPGKRNLRFRYDMPYRNFRTRAANDQFFMNVPVKNDLRFL